MSDRSPRLPTPGVVRPLTALESGRHGPVLWALVVGFALADTVLTVIGLELGLSEANPVARSALSLLGPAGLVLLKGFSLGLLAVIVRTVPGRFEPAALLGFCLPQAAATGVNATLILSQTGTIAGL
ncbi:DUF5658 family protein [Haloarcula pelagica]|uniref:DUF5658 family protein n=1 Tax=Haloarcula pelagica TaxID=3033389 RepID=UPI0024C3DBAF|nr:DUF5658 family protein [Halomicroarcula sp. YJ-61-S]